MHFLGRYRLFKIYKPRGRGTRPHQNYNNVHIHEWVLRTPGTHVVWWRNVRQWQKANKQWAQGNAIFQSWTQVLLCMCVFMCVYVCVWCCCSLLQFLKFWMFLAVNTKCLCTIYACCVGLHAYQCYPMLTSVTPLWEFFAWVNKLPHSVTSLVRLELTLNNCFYSRVYTKSSSFFFYQQFPTRIVGQFSTRLGT